MINLGYFFNFGSCGYYCLKHIIGKFKCDNKKYMSLYEVSEILKKNNYACISVRLSSVDDILFDCITLMRVNKLSYHYIILKKIKNKYIYYYDPLFLFVRRMKVSKFNKKWSKVCLFYTKV